MVFAWGQKFYGKVLAHGGSYVVTRFSYFNLVPMIARASYLVAGERVFGLPEKHARSVRAGYVRVWSLVLGLAGGALTTNLPGGGAPLVLLGAACAAWSWLRVGRPSPDEIAMRERYAMVAGIPVDIALLVEATQGEDALAAQAWLDEIRATATQQLREPSPYRDEGSKLLELVRDDEWNEVASLAGSLPAPSQAAAMTVARIAMLTSKKKRVREGAKDAHEALFAAGAPRLTK